MDASVDYSEKTSVGARGCGLTVFDFEKAMDCCRNAILSIL
ncbi:hypothetical protein [Bellilinea sp.]